MTTLRIATRGSQLALTQAKSVADLVETKLDARAELVVIKTSGDRLRDVSLAAVGGKGLFVKEIEEALLEGRADLAVHSAKDLPAAMPPELELVACPPRADPRDALIGRRPGMCLADLPHGARVGTGSARRRAQLLAARPDLEIVPMRGNVPTRLSKLESQELDAVLLACAGLERLGMAERIDERIDPGVLLPAVGQGVLALQARRGEPHSDALRGLGDPETERALAAERCFLCHLEGDCNVPLAALAEWGEAGRLRLRGLVSSVDGKRVARAEIDASADTAEASGRKLAELVLERGGVAILQELREGVG